MQRGDLDLRCVRVCVCVELVVILVEVVAVVMSAWAGHAYAWQSLRQSWPQGRWTGTVRNA